MSCQHNCDHYFPFGEEINSDNSQRNAAYGYGADDGMGQQFASKERDDETGLDFSEARYYAPTQGRFTSVDPVLITGDRLIDPQQINLYHYARNNPLHFTDPTGEDIDDSSLKNNKDYQAWKTAFLNTKTGKDFWGKYSRHQYKVTITMGDNGGGKYGAETTPTFDANGRLTGGTIVLGTDFAKKALDPSSYPIGSVLTPDERDSGGHHQYPIDREARAVAFLAHEFGHLDDDERMGGAKWQQENDLLNRHREGMKAQGQQWTNTPEYRSLLSQCGCNDINDLHAQRELRAESAAISALKDYFGKGAGHGSMPKRVNQAIQSYEKGRPR